MMESSQPGSLKSPTCSLCKQLPKIGIKLSWLPGQLLDLNSSKRFYKATQNDWIALMGSGTVTNKGSCWKIHEGQLSPQEQEAALTNWTMTQDASIWLATGSNAIPRSSTVNFCMAGKYCSLVGVFSTITIPWRLLDFKGKKTNHFVTKFLSGLRKLSLQTCLEWPMVLFKLFHT